jgi:diguanylate cyclase (GGDEF)-like protein/PAS domain S-box-containing protein
MTTPIRILYVDDSAHDRALVRDALEQEHGGFHVTEANSRAVFEAHLAKGEFDLVLSDFNILGFDGLQVIDIVAARRPDLPVIIVTGTGSEEIGVEAMKRGAADYVIKTLRHIRRLPQSILMVLETKRLRQEKETADVQLKESEALFHTLAKVAPVGIFRTDADGGHVYSNQRWSDIAGISQQAATGRGWTTALHPDDRRRVAEAWYRSVASGVPFQSEYRFQRPDGSIAWALEQAAPDVGDAGEVRGYVGTIIDITERVERQNELTYRANHDELTGLLNRAATRECLEESLRQAGSRGVPLGVIALNVDRIHQVNDTLGYAIGDAVLIEVAQRLRHFAAERHCSVGRIGGDEFALITDVGVAQGLFESMAQHCTQALAQPYVVDGQMLYLTCCAGVSWYPESGDNASKLLSEADLALNLAKRRGRGQIAVFSPNRSAELAERITIGSDMRGALARQEMQLHYQPVIDAANGSIAGAEALIRWNSAKLGAVSPSQFVPIAEDTGFIVQLGDWTLRTAIAQISAWSGAGRTVPISVNVSAGQFHRAEFIEELEDDLQESKVPPRLLKIEITESMLMGNEDATINMLRRLKGLGVRISLDDFGTGYSSLSYLRRLPIDEIKIDRSFVSDITQDSYAATLCRAIIAMSQQLALTVTAEGVETEAQANFLKDAGCQLMQGFLFSGSVPANTMGELLVRNAVWTLGGKRTT